MARRKIEGFDLWSIIASAIEDSPDNYDPFDIAVRIHCYLDAFGLKVVECTEREKQEYIRRQTERAARHPVVRGVYPQPEGCSIEPLIP